MHMRIATFSRFLSVVLAALMAGPAAPTVRAVYPPGGNNYPTCPPEEGGQVPDNMERMPVIGADNGGHGGGVDPCSIMHIMANEVSKPATQPNPPRTESPRQTGDSNDQGQADPIYPASGNARLDETDVVVPAPLLTLSFLRSYNSYAMSGGAMGRKWHHSFDWFAVEEPNEMVVGNRTGTFVRVQAIADGFAGSYGGMMHWFHWIPTQQRYEAVGGGGCDLYKDAKGLFVMTMPGGYRAHFNLNGSLAAFEHVAGQSVNLTYSNNVLARVQHSNGQYLDFRYSNGLLSSVHTPMTNFWIEYRHGGGDLTNVVRHTPRGDFSLSYEYERRAMAGAPDTGNATNRGYWTTDGAGRRIWTGPAAMPPVRTETNSFSTGKLVKRVNARGETFHFTYGDSGGVGSRASGTWMDLPVSQLPASLVISTNRGNGYYRTALTYTGTNTTLIDTFAGGKWRRTAESFDPHWRDMLGFQYPDGIAESLTRNSARDITNSRLTEGGDYVEWNGTYDARHNVTSERGGLNSAGSNVWTYTWSEFRSLESVTDPLGRQVVIAQSNALPVKVGEIFGVGQSLDTTLSYSTNGLLLAVTNAAGRSLRIEYDQRGYATNFVPVVGPSLALGYDALGHATRFEHPGPTGSRVYQIEPDERGRAQRVTYPNGLETRSTFDPYGKLLQQVDAAGRTSRFTYVAGKLVRAARVLEGATPVEVAISQKYDEQFNTLHITDPMGRKVEAYQLDDNDRIVAVTNLENQTMEIQWKAGSLVDSVKRFDGSTVRFDYDGEGLMTAINQPGTTNSFVWLANGLLESADHDGKVIRLGYDELNRLSSVTQAVPGGVLAYRWTPDGLVSNVAAPAGSYAYDYDAAGRLTTLAAPAGSFSIGYDPYNGQPASVSGLGATEAYGYDDIDRLTNIAWGALGGLDYSHDNASMITQVVDRLNARTNAYRYDSLYRLTEERTFSATSAASVVEYQYDLAGNRTQMVENGVATVYTCDNANRLLSWSGGGHAFYDAAGNTTTLIHNAGRRLDLQWNSRYELVAAYTNGVLAEKYEYDAFGRRTSISDGTTTNYLIYDGPHVIAETDASGGPQRSYTYGPGIDNILAMTIHTGPKAGTYRYLKNHQNTVLALLDINGSLVERYQYDAWGNVAVFDASGSPRVTSAFGNRYLFQGREHSFATGLTHFRARWCSATLGRWISKDPKGISGGNNLYSFCLACPTLYVDPQGLEAEEYLKSTDGQELIKKLIQRSQWYSPEEHEEGAHVYLDIKTGERKVQLWPPGKPKQQDAGGMEIGVPPELGRDMKDQNRRVLFTIHTHPPGGSRGVEGRDKENSDRRGIPSVVIHPVRIDLYNPGDQSHKQFPTPQSP